jgi:protein-S-isoprenylcysteine O-methyltransferase Ste14
MGAPAIDGELEERTRMGRGYALIRHLILLVVLPVTIVVLVPIWLAQRYGVRLLPPAGAGDSVIQALGWLLLAAGLLLCGASLYQIAARGLERWAPWDPARQLVLRGPYRFVRNPMISGAIFVLFGEALVLQSLPHALWAVAFLLLSLFYVPVLEEPQLEARYGDEYRRYLRHVPRFLPRLRPWSPERG